MEIVLGQIQVDEEREIVTYTLTRRGDNTVQEKVLPIELYDETRTDMGGNVSPGAVISEIIGLL